MKPAAAVLWEREPSLSFEEVSTGEDALRVDFGAYNAGWVVE